MSYHESRFNQLAMPLALTAALLGGCASRTIEGSPYAVPGAMPTTELAPPVTTAPEATPTLAPTSAPVRQGKTVKRKLTFYGAADNTPRGSTDIASDVQPEAGGTGSFEDPLTMAIRIDMPGYNFGQRFYVGGLNRYFMYADECGDDNDPSSCDTDFDLYMGNPSKNDAVEDCEAQLTPDYPQEVLVDPPDGLPTDTTPLWNDAKKECNTGAAHWSPN